MMRRNRRGKSNSAIALGLFLLSCLLVVPALQWAFTTPAQAPGKRSYVLKPDLMSNRNLAELDPAAYQLSVSDLSIRDWHHVTDLAEEIAQFETVFWEPNDTDSLREYLAQSKELHGARVLEIGTGTGLVALCCARLGAAHVVATDINPAAYANARYNAEHLKLSRLMDVRLVPPDQPEPFSVVGDDEQFDFIISNPPWEDQGVGELAAHALYDPGFELLDGILQNASTHLSADGQLLLAYGAKQAIRRIIEAAPQHHWKVQIADQRSLDDLPEVFLPGMLLVLTK